VPLSSSDTNVPLLGLLSAQATHEHQPSTLLEKKFAQPNQNQTDHHGVFTPAATEPDIMAGKSQKDSSQAFQDPSDPSQDPEHRRHKRNGIPSPADEPIEPKGLLMAIGGGTGASVGYSDYSTTEHNQTLLLRRMHYQDKAVIFLVLMVYLVALCFSASLTYRHSCNNSPVTYYSDPRFHNTVMNGDDLDDFIGEFNQPPKNIALHVAGFLPVPDDTHESLRWQDQNFHCAFTFSLDLSPWVVREAQMRTDDEQTRTLQDGMLPEERDKLHFFLDNDTNDLSYTEIDKRVSWLGWEELATNIKHKIRQAGFQGHIRVSRAESDQVQIYKNKAWANFMHARATRVLCALSILGWVIYVPYMWLRCKKLGLKSFFRVDISIADYWPLIADKLTADGFQDNQSIVSPSRPANSS